MIHLHYDEFCYYIFRVQFVFLGITKISLEKQCQLKCFIAVQKKNE